MTKSKPTKLEQVPPNSRNAYQPLNEEYDPFPRAENIPFCLIKALNMANLAAYGIASISRILEANDVEKDNVGGQPLDGHVAGGLAAAVRVIAELLHSELETTAEYMNRRGGDQ